MATYRKRGNGWRAEVRKHGHYFSSSFSTKAQARDWATQKEAEIVEGKIEEALPHLLVREAFKRYATEVSPGKGGARWEIIRLKSLCREPLARVYLSDLKTQHMATFRDKRLRSVSPGTVNRDLSLMSAVFTRARKEWGWLKENPIRDLELPKSPRPRERLISQEEIRRVIIALGYRDDRPVQTKTELVGLFFLLALETGMRLGELCRMTHTSMHLDKRYVQLIHTKNGDRRQVPLSTRAIELCSQFRTTNCRVSAAVAGALFRKALKQAEVTNLHFHDTRHEAVTRLARKLDVLALARMIGHRDLKSLMIYYNESATELAEMLG